MNYERRMLLLVLVAGAPSTGVALLFLLGNPDWPLGYTVALGVICLGCFVGGLTALPGNLNRPLRTLSNLLAGLREGDYSISARRMPGKDAMSEVFAEIHELVETMREQRLGAVEASNLLRTVIAEIDVAIFTFDESLELRLINRFGERLLGTSNEKAIGRNAGELGLQELLEGKVPRTVERSFPEASGRWRVSRSVIREKGRPHQLLVVSDLTRELREEELMAWQRLVRVLGHELNNSLAPIKSIAGTLGTLLAKEPPPEDFRQDMEQGLEVIAARAESLDRFMKSYARLARLPAPRRQKVDLAPLVRRLAALETRLEVQVCAEPGVSIQADPDQLEQLLINLIRNAADAALDADAESEPEVRVQWKPDDQFLTLEVLDSGPGLSNPSNLFVPFFTTKPGGSGIGLALSRQIVEGHNGRIELQNRTDAPGCVAVVRLPVQ